jgi:hypothetical protein
MKATYRAGGPESCLVGFIRSASRSELCRLPDGTAGTCGALKAVHEVSAGILTPDVL